MTVTEYAAKCARLFPNTGGGRGNRERGVRSALAESICARVDEDDEVKMRRRRKRHRQIVL
jgi:hypothetical protein